MYSSVKLVLLIFVFHNVKSQTDYCKLSCDGTQHTVCERKDVNCGAGTKCKNFKAMTLTDADRQLVIDIHNQLRNKVATGKETIGPQPSASNMRALSYSKELEYIAQCHTNSCEWGHDKCRRTPQWGWVGQNIMLKSYKGTVKDAHFIVNSSIYGFYDEVVEFQPSWVSSFRDYGKEVGHYTAIVWALTEYVGCGLTFYVSSDGWDVYYLACNYGPGGNISPLSVYEVGNPASNCGGLPVNSKYPGLCGQDKL